LGFFNNEVPVNQFSYQDIYRQSHVIISCQLYIRQCVWNSY